MKLKMTLHGNFAFFEDRKKEELLVVLPYMKDHFATVETPSCKPISLHHKEPSNFTLTGITKGGALGTVVDSTNQLLCMQEVSRKKAKFFGSICVPLHFGVTTPLPSVNMQHPFKINSGSVKNPEMLKFAEKFVLEFEYNCIPRLKNDEGDDITLSCGEVSILCGPKKDMDLPSHRGLAAKANAAHFTGLDVTWDGYLGINAWAEAPGCSPSMGSGRG